MRLTRPFVLALALLCGATALAQAQRKIADRGPAHFADRSRNLPSEPITAIAIDPNDDQVVYVGLDGFVFRSDDGGDSWVPVLSFPRGLADDGSLNDTNVDSFDSATAGQAVDGSVADGALDEGAAAGSVALTDIDDLPDGDIIDPEDIDISDLPEGDDIEDALDDLQAQRDAAEAAVDDVIDIVDVSVPPRADPGVRAIAFVPRSRGMLWVATPRGLYRSTTNAASFDRVRLPGAVRENDVRDVAVDPVVPSRVWVGTAAGLFQSNDGGASFERAPGRAGRTPVTDIDVSEAGAREPSHLLVGGERGLIRSKDGGVSFADLLLRGGGAFPTVHSVAWSKEADTIYAGTADGLFVAVRGAVILERYAGMPETPPSAISPDPLWTSGIAVAVRGADGGVLFSDDHGLNRVDVDILPAAAPTALARERKDPTRLWVATNRGVFRLEPGSGVRIKQDALTALRERFAKEPDIDTVTYKALRSHGFVRADDDARSRASYAAFLPSVQLRYDGYTGDANSSRNTFIFRDPSALDPILDPDFDGNDLFGDGLLIISPRSPVFHRVFVQLEWDLERLILSRDLLRSARQVPLLRNAERRLVDRTRQLYLARRRLLAEMMTQTTTQPTRDRIYQELRLQELDAQLAALAHDDLFSEDD